MFRQSCWFSFDSALPITIHTPKSFGSITFAWKDGTQEGRAALKGTVSNRDNSNEVTVSRGAENAIQVQRTGGNWISFWNALRNVFSVGVMNANFEISEMGMEGIPWITDSLKKWISPGLATINRKWFSKTLESDLADMQESMKVLAESALNATGVWNGTDLP